MLIAELKGVTKIYDGVVVGVSGVDLEIPTGITGFLGPNGAGKSTVIKLMAGELRPTVGEVRVLGQDPWNNPNLQKQLAFISEVSAQFEFLSSIQLLTHLGRLHGYPRQEARQIALNSLEKLGLGEFCDRKLTALSKGMKQRAKIAAALMFPRSFILADEPLAGLDPFGRRLVLNLFQELARDGTSILVSSNILFELEKFTEMMILIYNGQVIASGETNVIRQKLTDFPYGFKLRISDHLRLGSLLLAEEGLIQSLELLDNDSRTKDSQELIITTTHPLRFQDYLQQILASEPDLILYELKNIESEKSTEAIFDYLTK